MGLSGLEWSRVGWAGAQGVRYLMMGVMLLAMRGRGMKWG